MAGRGSPLGYLIPHAIEDADRSLRVPQLGDKQVTLIGIDEFMPDNPTDCMGTVRIPRNPGTPRDYRGVFHAVRSCGPTSKRRHRATVCARAMQRDEESPCVLCDLGDPRKDYHVTPVYAVADAAVRALVISDAHSPFTRARSTRTNC